MAVECTPRLKSVLSLVVDGYDSSNNTEIARIVTMVDAPIYIRLNPIAGVVNVDIVAFAKQRHPCTCSIGKPNVASSATTFSGAFLQPSTLVN